MFLFFLIFPMLSHGQYLESKWKLNLNTTLVTPTGEKTIAQNSITNPAFSSNFKKSIGIESSLLHKLNKNIWIGIGFNREQFTNWKNNNYEDFYSNAKLNNIGMGPIIQYMTPFTKSGVLNWFKSGIFIQPTYNVMKIEANSINRLVLNDGEEDLNVIVNMNQNNLGLSVGFSTEFQLSQLLCIFGKYSYSMISAESKLFDDSNFQFHKIGIGIIINLDYDKKSLFK